MKKRFFCLVLVLFLLAGLSCACADPDLTLQDTSLRSGEWAGVYSQILTERSEGIRAYEDYVLSITYSPLCRAVGLTDLTGDGVPELLFLDLLDDTEYGFKVGRLWIYTADESGVSCALTFRPEIDDLLYSTYYLAEDGTLTLHFSDCEMGWILQLRRGKDGRYAAETTLVSQEDFSGEGPDTYYRNGKKITAKKYQSLKEQIRSGEGTAIGSLQVDEGGYGFNHTLAEALEALSAGTVTGAGQPGAGTDPQQSPDPEGSRFPVLSFTEGSFTPGQKFAVYSAPSTRAWRGASGKAAVTSGSEIIVAGTEDGWILILYELNSGVVRAGYIQERKIRGEHTSGDALSFSRTRMTLAESTAITDDPVRQQTAMGKLKKGTEVICLAEYGGLIYVEAKVSGKTARGFIPPSSLGPAD